MFSIINDERRALLGRQVQAFVKCAGGAAAIANPGHGDNILPEIAAGHGDAGHHWNQITQHGDWRNDVTRLQIAKVAGAVLALCGRSVFGHVLGENVAGLESLHKQRADVANHGRQPIAGLERVGCADRDRLLAEARIDAADDFVLAEQLYEAVFEPAIEQHEVVEIEVLVGSELSR